MAYARITVTYIDGSSTCAEVGHNDAHPDLLDELVARCKALYLETVADTEAEPES